jgi:hypothetical protein
VLSWRELWKVLVARVPSSIDNEFPSALITSGLAVSLPLLSLMVLSLGALVFAWRRLGKGGLGNSIIKEIVFEVELNFEKSDDKYFVTDLDWGLYSMHL